MFIGLTRHSSGRATAGCAHCVPPLNSNVRLPMNYQCPNCTHKLEWRERLARKCYICKSTLVVNHHWSEWLAFSVFLLQAFVGPYFITFHRNHAHWLLGYWFLPTLGLIVIVTAYKLTRRWRRFRLCKSTSMPLTLRCSGSAAPPTELDR